MRFVLDALGLEAVDPGDEVDAAVDERRDPDVRGVERDDDRLVVGPSSPVVNGMRPMSPSSTMFTSTSCPLDRCSGEKSR